LFDGFVRDDGGVVDLLAQLLQHLLPVVLEAAFDLRDSLLLDHPQLAFSLTNQTLVVRNNNNTTCVILDSVPQGVDGLDVEVVGGLVENDDVGGAQGQFGQGHARLLSA